MQLLFSAAQGINAAQPVMSIHSLTVLVPLQTSLSLWSCPPHMQPCTSPWYQVMGTVLLQPYSEHNAYYVVLGSLLFLLHD